MLMFVGNLPELGEEAPSFPQVLGYKGPMTTLLSINPVLQGGVWEIFLGITAPYDLTSASGPSLGFGI